MVKPRIAVVSPFLDKRHGTERRVAEEVERLAGEFEFHIYSQRVEDLDLTRVVWHRVPDVSGPLLVKYLWWFLANHLWRWWDRRIRGLRFDLVYSPGVNCLDADVVSVHIVFAEYLSQARRDLKFRRQHPRAWPRLVHRRLYYSLIVILERIVYGSRSRHLCVISRKTAKDLARFYGRTDPLPLIYHGLDLQRFNPEIRARLRLQARRELGLSGGLFVVLLVGNDWVKKGLSTLLRALANLSNKPLYLLVVGSDDPAPYQQEISRYGLTGRIAFHPIRRDVEFYYAAADAYVGPSLEDAFALPPAEAMACGLPVIVSSQAGVSEIVTHGEDGLILQDPRDAQELASLLARLLHEPEFARRLGARATQTAARYTWDANAAAMRELFWKALTGKRQP